MKEPGWEFSQDTGERVFLFFAKSVIGSLMTTVSQDLGLTPHLNDGVSYSTGSPLLHWGIGDILTRGKIAPYWPTNTISSSNLIFSGGLSGPSK